MKRFNSFASVIVVAFFGIVGWLLWPEVDPLVALAAKVRATNYVAASSRLDRVGDDLYWPAQELQAVLSVVNGVTVTYGDSHGYDGLTQHRSIVISESMEWNARMEVLAHEAGHVLQPNGLTQAEGEVFAEGVAYLVLRHYGHDRIELHAHYLAARKSGLYVLENYATDIKHAAGVLLAR
jgi:hypothetical protein